jgi:hypothetical protein
VVTIVQETVWAKGQGAVCDRVGIKCRVCRGLNSGCTFQSQLIFTAEIFRSRCDKRMRTCVLARMYSICRSTAQSIYNVY